TTRSTNDMIVTAHTISSAATWTTPGGMTEGVDITGGGQSLEVNYVTQATIAATGAKTATATATATGVTQTVALKPAYQSYFAFGFSDGTTGGSGSSASQNGVGTSAVSRRMA